ncbi:MAG: 16S rRNA (guanine(527)-N(7))-methyltransferase RsmG [Clostridia bacterium]|nr:16S rRNA (guanine(527)-N(7))-methyltransferase RsmG [Clostridia bacterium]
MILSIISDCLKPFVSDSEKINNFEKYYNLLIEWNEKMNLTAITDGKDVATKHFLDSVSSLESGVIKDDAKIIDVGTGAGFPGIPLKIFKSDLDVTLMDSLNKRINFLNEVISELQLDGIRAIHSRAEDLGKKEEHREAYDIAISRAVANLASLSELCLPFVKVGGYFVSMKGPKASEEIKDAKNAIRLMGGEYVETINYSLSDTDLEHNLVIIKKVSPTPKKYPRNAPKPIKEPLL